jgi:hypothetical protein
MYFYVDESGHSGSDLFDEQQPNLYYGVLSSSENIDVIAEKEIACLRKQVNHDRLHANELGIGRLMEIAPQIEKLQKSLDISFDVYRFVKADHPIISFFDQVFDSGMNDAVSYETYWTPKRYLVLLNVAMMFTPEIAKMAWAARIESNDKLAQQQLVEVCKALLKRVNEAPFPPIRKIIRGAISWAENNPGEIHYNVSNKKDVTTILPNAVAFQLVMQGIANRLAESSATATKIVVDRQSQFNKSQKWLAKFYGDARGIDVQTGSPGMPQADWSHMPTIPIQIATDAPSAGLELVDLRLWVTKKMLEKKAPRELIDRILGPHLERTMTDDISLSSIADRWLPELLTGFKS